MKVNTFKRFFEFNPVQKFYKNVCNPKNSDFFNNTLPTLESVVSTGLYCYFTEKQKNIPREQKNVLQWQNVLGGAGGIALGSYLNRKVSSFADKLIPHIDKNTVDLHKITTGIKIGLPLVATAFVMRFLTPIVVAQVSTVIEDHRRKNKHIDKIA